MFIPRMWFDEVERIGKQRCTPRGYALQQVGDAVGMVGLLTVLTVPLYLAYRAASGTLHASLFSLLLVPPALGVLGSIIVSQSWALARRKQFHYDYERRESTWIEAGKRCMYTFSDWQAAQRPRRG